MDSLVDGLLPSILSVLIALFVVLSIFLIKKYLSYREEKKERRYTKYRK